jgi:hypothetical protein
MPFMCDDCVCGVCVDSECQCECHLLCTVCDEDLKELCVIHGLAKNDSRHKRNMLFKRIYDSEEPIAVLTYGIKHYVLQEKSLRVPHAVRRQPLPPIRKPVRKQPRKLMRKQTKKAPCVDSDG